MRIDCPLERCGRSIQKKMRKGTHRQNWPRNKGWKLGSRRVLHGWCVVRAALAAVSICEGPTISAAPYFFKVHSFRAAICRPPCLPRRLPCQGVPTQILAMLLRQRRRPAANARPVCRGVDRPGGPGWVHGPECARSSAARLLSAISGGLSSANAATDGGRNAASAAHCTTLLCLS